MKPDNVLAGLDTPPPDEPSQLRLWIVVLWALGIAVFAIIASAPGSPLQPPQPSATTPLQGVAQSLGLGDRSLGTLVVLTVLGLAITLGGFDSLVGAVVGGFVIGILSSVLPQYVGWFEKMPLAPVFILILAVLLFRPEGLFGRKQVSRV